MLKITEIKSKFEAIKIELINSHLTLERLKAIPIVHEQGNYEALSINVFDEAHAGLDKTVASLPALLASLEATAFNALTSTTDPEDIERIMPVAQSIQAELEGVSRGIAASTKMVESVASQLTANRENRPKN